jgi:opacity protein-like surface antigen
MTNRSQFLLNFVFAALLLSAASPALSQVPQAARKGAGSSLVVGAGFADYDTNWSGRLGGPTAWADWNFRRGPSLLHGLGIEAEGRDLNYARTGGVPNLRMDTGEGGLIYTLRQNHRLHPYGKFLLGLGSIDFTIRGYPNYKHDTRTVYAPGGGVEFRALGNIWVRGDYEYQFWPDLVHSHALNPQGFTIGLSYHF